MIRKLSLCLVVVCATGMGACAAPRPAPHDDAPAVAGRKDPGRHCLKHTGTYLRLAADQCASAVGRSYSREDIDRSGAVETGDIVRRLLLY